MDTYIIMVKLKLKEPAKKNQTHFPLIMEFSDQEICALFNIPSTLQCICQKAVQFTQKICQQHLQGCINKS
jgi:hypothetical protein